MNREWTELNKSLQLSLKKEESFDRGIDELLLLREKLMEQILSFQKDLSSTDFSAMPFVRAQGNHSTTIAWSLYHLFRIEDIVSHTLIKKDAQIFFIGDYQCRMHSSIITTGNELTKQEMAVFSEHLDIDALYEYLSEVCRCTTQLLKQLTFQDMKTKMSEQDKEELRRLKVVSTDEEAVWLLDYWCGKTVEGLIRMPLSRHWIMHVEACLRIADKIHGKSKRG